MVSFFDSHLKFQQKSKMKEPSNKWTCMPSKRNRERRACLRVLAHKPGSKCSSSGHLRSWIKRSKFLKELWCFSAREYNKTILVASRYPTLKSCGCKFITFVISRFFFSGNHLLYTNLIQSECRAQQSGLALFPTLSTCPSLSCEQ